MLYNETPINGLFDAAFFEITSSHVNDTFRIFVGKPAVIEPGKRYPAIFSLDGNASFASLLGTQRLLAQGGQVPTSYVFGIGYPGNSLWESMVNRNRDYAPTDPGEIEAVVLGASEQAGGPVFLRFIREELKPLLAECYPIDEDDSTVLGVSLGGLFAAWTLFNEPTTFHNYILSSPALWWRNEQVWEWEKSFADNRDDLPATVFIGAGELEVKEHLRADALVVAKRNPMLREQAEWMIAWSDEHGWPEVARLTSEFAKRLQSRKYPGLSILYNNFEDENHMSAPPAIASRGLRYVFESWRP